MTNIWNDKAIIYKFQDKIKHLVSYYGHIVNSGVTQVLEHSDGIDL